MKEGLNGKTPLDFNRLRLSKVKSTAAGIPAAVSSMNHGIRKMGVAKTVRSLLMVNQKDGFDCPGLHGPILTIDRHSNSVKMVRKRLLMKQ